MTGYGSLDQLGEHLPYKQRVSGSSPLTSTNKHLRMYVLFFFFIADGLVICQPVEGHRFEPCNAYQTKEIRTFYQTVRGSDLLLFL